MQRLGGVLASAELDDDSREVLASVRQQHRTILAAFLLLSDSAHQAHLAALGNAISSGSDLGPSLTLEQFDQEFSDDAE
jgi:hypothetical protein